MDFTIEEKVRNGKIVGWSILRDGEEFASIHSRIDHPEYWFWSSNVLNCSKEKLCARSETDSMSTPAYYLIKRINIRIRLLNQLGEFLAKQ